MSDPTLSAEFPSMTSSNLKMTAVLWIDRSVRAWNVTVAALLQNPKIAQIHLAFAKGCDEGDFVKDDPRVIRHGRLPLAEFTQLAFSQAEDFVLFCTWPGKPSPETFDLGLAWMSEDPRIGTMSFLSNAAGAFSFPHRNTGTAFGVDGHDEVTLTRLLRARRAPLEGPTPVQMPDGSMIIASRAMWDVCGEIDDHGTENLALAINNLALRANRRGFGNFLDTSGYITMPYDDVEPYQSVLLNPEARHSLHLRFPHFPFAYDVECARPKSVLGEALNLARARALGLSVLIDGSAIGPKEMGTQVLTLKLSLALAERAEIKLLVVAVPDPANLPTYAKDLARHPKIRLVQSGALDFPGAPQVDVIHRPYQPSMPIPWSRWREISKRTLITVQDLIAYRNPAYFSGPEEWLNYRDNLALQLAQVDGVCSISHDVRKVLDEERVPIDPSRIHVVENGADTRSKSERGRIPDAILDRGWASSPYLFVLGANYAHKNRDVAIRVWAKLREQGYPHKIVFAGASVPQGSLRVEEALLSSAMLDPHMLFLPDISSEDRDWLLANSSLVMYPTAAEGFGFVPFEAACQDVPTLFVSFGPLRELTNDPGLPNTYDLEGLTKRAKELLDDPASARAAIAGVLSNSDQLTWAETARKSVDAYFATLAKPSRAIGV